MIDVLFKDVVAVCLPTAFRDPRIEQSDITPATPFLDAQSWMNQTHTCFLFHAPDPIGYVIAGVGVFVENDDEYYDESVLMPKLPGIR